MSESETVIVQAAEDRRIMQMTINRPNARNAVNGEVARGLAKAMDRLDREPTFRVGVLHGSERGFSAGMDLKAFLDDDLPVIDGRGFGGFAQQPPVKPLIAAVEGYAVAGGLEMALACDLIVVAEDALLSLPEVKRSLVAAGGGLLRLAQRIPYYVAAELVLTGEPLSVERLYQVGLVNRVVPPGQALKVALELAGQIAENAPLAVEGSKQILQHAPDWGLARGWDLQADIADRVTTSEDAREGARAFAERRQPRWQGR